MKKSIEYLKDAKEKLGIESDYGLAKALKTNQQNISRYMSGESQMDDYHCIKVAQVLDLDPMEIIAAAQEEREKNPEKQRFWQDFREARSKERGQASVPMMMTVAMTGLIALLSVKWPDLMAIYIMSNLVAKIMARLYFIFSTRLTRFMSHARNTFEKLTSFSDQNLAVS